MLVYQRLPFFLMGRSGWHSAKMTWKFCLDWCLPSWCLRVSGVHVVFWGEVKDTQKAWSGVFYWWWGGVFDFWTIKNNVGLGFFVGNNWALHATGRANDSQWCNYWCRPLASRSSLRVCCMLPKSQAGNLQEIRPYLGGGFKYVYFHAYLGKWSNFTNIFQRGWNHQQGCQPLLVIDFILISSSGFGCK